MIKLSNLLRHTQLFVASACSRPALSGRWLRHGDRAPWLHLCATLPRPSSLRLLNSDSCFLTPVFCLLASVSWLLTFSSCSTFSSAPRVIEVTSHKHTQDIEYEDKRQLFLQDKASRLHGESKPLPESAQFLDFYVSWSGKDIAAVKFEYRQINHPNTIFSQEYKLPSAKNDAPGLLPSSHTFLITGTNFIAGGAVTAWRITLWSPTDTKIPVAYKKSTLW